MILRFAQWRLPTFATMQFWNKKAIFLLSVSFLTLSACGNKKTANTAARERAIIDSMVAERLEEVNAKAMEDLDYRISIEVKQKADSIVAQRSGKLKAD